jgi:hypothetical protein
MIKDILLDENFECLVSARDVVVGDASEQVCVLLANTEQGEWKNAPLSGWNMKKRKAQPRSEMRKLVPQILEELARNGIEAKVRVVNDNIDIEL